MKIHSWLLCCVLASAGCSFQLFKDIDDIKAETWVDVSSKPDQISSRDWPVALASGGATTTGVKFVSVGVAPVAFARMAYDDRGALDTKGLRLNDSNAEDAVSAVATDMRAAAVGSNNVAIAYSDGTGPVVALVNGETGTSETQLFLNSDFGLDGLDAPTALAVDRAGALHVALETSILSYPGFGAGGTPFECFAPPMMADGPADGEAFAALAFLAGTPGADGTLFAVTDEDIYPFFISGETCAVGEFPSAEGGGASAILGQFGGDPATFDLAVGSPDNGTVTLYLDIATDTMDMNTLAAANNVEISAPAGAVAFGERLARGDIDGDGIDELIVADSRATVGGSANAGAVHIYSSGAFDKPEVTLSDADPTANQRFGVALAVSPFEGTDDLLAIGTRSEVFTYFRLAVGTDEDVRTR